MEGSVIFVFSPGRWMAVYMASEATHTCTMKLLWRVFWEKYTLVMREGGSWCRKGMYVRGEDLVYLP
jgi:hypothetical protein